MMKHVLSAGEGEYVPFAGDCMCEGPVEVWLQSVVDAMRSALSAEFKVPCPRLSSSNTLIIPEVSQRFQRLGS